MQPQQLAQLVCLQGVAAEEALLIRAIRPVQRGQAGAVQAGMPMLNQAVLIRHQVKTGQPARQA